MPMAIPAMAPGLRAVDATGDRVELGLEEALGVVVAAVSV